MARSDSARVISAVRPVPERLRSELESTSNVKEGEQGSGLSPPTLGRRGPKASYVTALKVVGMVPIVCRAGGNTRPLYVR